MSVFDWLAEAFGQAVTDIRQKVVEEPFFGRAVTPPAEKAQQPSLAQAMGWTQGETAKEPPGREQERGIDR